MREFFPIMTVVLKKKLVFLILFSQTYIVKSSLANNNFKFKVRENYRFNTESVLQSIRTTSHLECAGICSVRQDCVSMSFKSPEENCLLSKKATIDDTLRGPGVPEGLEFEAGWKTWSEIKYPVFHALGNYSRYKMTFEQGKQLCKDYGTAIAARSDLLYARELGFEFCACSWLADGSMGFVLQTPDYVCWRSFHNGIFECSLLYGDVYCKT